MSRKIIHIDMDAFYASVEIRDRPELQGKPVVIGGSPESRGVVSTANYEARKYGIHSAMSSALAYRLCPHAVFLSSNFDKYIAISQHLKEIFKRYTALIEPLSLDEAYLDVTDNPMGLRAVDIAQRIRQDVKGELQLTCSAGVAANKLIAKIASDFNKPDGLTVVLPENAMEFMRPLSLRKIHGVGPATATRLEKFGYAICQDIQRANLIELEQQLGTRLANWLHKSSLGIDERSVSTQRARKSMGRELTFPKDVKNMDHLEGALHALCDEVSCRLKRRRLVGRTMTVKIKYSDFQTITRSMTIEPVNEPNDWFEKAVSTLHEKTNAAKRAVRLIGFSISRLQNSSLDI